MSVLVLAQSEVRRLLPMPDCIELMRETLATLAEGDAIQPLRSLMRLPDGKSLLGVMPAYLGGRFEAHGIKIISLFPSNHGTEYDAHQGAVMLFEHEHGRPVAIVEASEITAIRTAAVSGLATRLLAREDARTLGILGSGTQARTHLEAMCAVRDVETVRVWSRHPQNARRFADRESERHRTPIDAVGSARDACEGADLICTTTTAHEPILEGAWLAPGTHVNAAGACTPTTRELDAEAVSRALLFTDRLESLLQEAGDFLLARAEGAVTDESVRGELGELLLGRVQGRGSPNDITLFESLGIGVEDVAAIHFVHAAAREQGVGTAIDFGGRVDAAD